MLRSILRVSLEALVVGVLLLVCAQIVRGEVPVISPHGPIAIIEGGKVRIYEVGPACYIAAGDGPMGGLILSGFCRINYTEPVR